VGIGGLSIADQDDALEALEVIDEGVMEVAGIRSQLGAVQSRFQFAMDNIDVQTQNLEEARSLIADVDVAEATSKLARATILQEAGTSVLVQANQWPQKMLRLIS
jgi:flagellin